MSVTATKPSPVRNAGRTFDLDQHGLFGEGILKLLAIKDSDIRILTLEQARDAVDKGLHSGGAFSATLPLVALYYGGFLNIDLEDPTRVGQDLFTLSKGQSKVPSSAGGAPSTTAQ